MKHSVFFWASTSFLAMLLVALPLQARREKRSVVAFETTEGLFRVALSDDTPLHRDNFLRLCERHAYDSLLFHRVIKDFMIQAGDPLSKHAQAGVLLGDSSMGAPIPAEFDLPYLYHWRGALAAAREPDEVNPEKWSSGSQFYIVWGKKHSETLLKRLRATLREKGIELTADMINTYVMQGGTPHLDGEFTVFGEVIEGLEVVNRIQSAPAGENDRPLKDIRILSARVEQLSKDASLHRTRSRP